MKRKLQVFVYLNEEGEEERIPLPPRSQAARYNYEAGRARTRAREILEKIEVQQGLPPHSEEEQTFLQAELKVAREQADTEFQRAVLQEALGRELEYQSDQAAAGTIEHWTFEVPDFGWTHLLLAEAEETAREWSEDGLTPRRNEWKFRDALLRECVGVLTRPDGTTVPVGDLGPTWTNPVWEALREKSEGGFDRVGFIRSCSPDGKTERPSPERS